VQERRWGSFDKDNTRMIFQYIPFADHNAMLDPPTVDITGRMLEMLQVWIHPCDKRVEKPSSSSSASRSRMAAVWPLGVNYIYGTFLVLRGLEPSAWIRLSPRCSRRRVIRMVQNPDGGWERLAAATTIPTRAVSGPARLRKLPGQCLASGRRDDLPTPLPRVRWLLTHQLPDAAGRING